MSSIILKHGDERVQPHPIADLLLAGGSARVVEDALVGGSGGDDGSGATEHREQDTAEPELHETTVEVLRQSGVTTGVEVRCACGEVKVIEFDYAAEAASSPEPPETGASE